MGLLPYALVALGLGAVVILRGRRLATLVLFTLFTVVLTGLFFGLFAPASDPRSSPLEFRWEPAEVGAWFGARFSGLFAVAAIGGRFVTAREILPHLARRNLPAYLAATVVRLAPLMREDAQRLRESQEARGHEFPKGVRRPRAWLPLVVPLFVVTMRRAREQAISLYLAGLAPDPSAHGRPGRRAYFWATVATLSALAVAGRLPFAGVPNVSLSFLVVFVGAVAFGPAVGFSVGLSYRLVSDLWLSGPNPIIVPWAVAEGVLGLLVGLVGRVVNFGQRRPVPPVYAVALAASAGWMFTLAFSVIFDTFDWAYAEFLGAGMGPALTNVPWNIYVIRGIAFNIHTMIFNAVLFGALVYPLLGALRASGVLPRPLAEPAPA